MLTFKSRVTEGCVLSGRGWSHNGRTFTGGGLALLVRYSVEVLSGCGLPLSRCGLSLSGCGLYLSGCGLALQGLGRLFMTGKTD